MTTIIDENNNQATPTPARPAIFIELLDEIPGQITGEEREHYEGLVSEEKARDEGARVESTVVLEDMLHVVHTALPFILAGKVIGYGPMRLRYTVELGLSLAEKAVERGTSKVDAVELRGSRTSHTGGTLKLRRRGIRALTDLVGQSEPAHRERARAAARTGEKRIAARADSLEALAAELEAAMVKVPASIAKEAGATSELVTALRDQAKAMLSVKTEASVAHKDVLSQGDVINVLEGRILFELRRLAAALKESRAGDVSVPALQSRIVQRYGRRKARAKAEVITEPAKLDVAEPRHPAKIA